MTEQKVNHQLTAEQLLQASFDAIQDGISILDKDLRILRVNKVMERWYNHAAPLVGKKCYEAYHQKSEPCESCPSLLAIKTGKVRQKEVPLIQQDTQAGWLELIAYPIKDQSGTVTGVVELLRNITNEKEQEKAAEARTEKALRQRTALVKLSAEPALVSGDLDQAAKALTEITAAAMQVERTSLWLLSDDQEELKCIDLFELSKKQHSSGMVLKSGDYPNYFKIIKQESRVYAEDTYQDYRTRDFVGDYLDLFDIRSMLDAGIFIEGQLVGVFCFEQVGSIKHWHIDDQSFASTVAAVAAQAIETVKRKKAERERLESEQKYKSLFQDSADPILIMQRKFVDCNEEACRFYGCEREEIIGRPPDYFSPLIQPDGQKSAVAADQFISAALKGKPQTFYWQHQNRNGKLLDTEVRLRRVIIQDEKFLIASVRDISERIKAEELIKQNRDWYRALAEDIPVLVTRIAPDGKVTYVNEASRSLIGMPEEKIIGTDFYALVPRAYREDLKRKFIKLTPEAPIVIYEHYNKGRLYRWKNRAIFNSDQTIKEYFTVGEDITEQHEAEQKLKDSEARNRALVDAIPDLIFRYDRDGRYLDLKIKNDLQLVEKARQFHRAGKLIGSKVGDYLSEDITAKLLDGIDKALSSGKPQVLEYSYDVDNEIRHFEARLVSTGKDEVISIVRDITERKSTDEAMRYQLQFEKLAADISSHFINAPTDQIDEAINFALKLSGEFFEADRSYIMRFSENQQFIINPYEWCAPGIFSVQERNQSLPVANTPWWARQILNNEYVSIPDVDALPEEAELDKEDFKVEAIKSLITIPIMKYGKVYAFFGLETVKAKKNWTRQQVSLLKVLAGIITESLAKAEALDALKESEERYREILLTIEEGYYEADLSGRITFCNEAAGSLFGGYSIDELKGISYKQLYQEPEKAYQTFHRVFTTGIPEKGLILEMIKKDGSNAFGEISVSLIKDKDGFINGFKGIGKDVTERIEYEKKLEFLSLHDQLTGIRNRAYYESELDRLEGGREYPVTIITADLDGLKLINDTLGHDVGDRLLCSCAVLLKDSLRQSDMVARVGGDEFSAILRQTEQATGELIVKRIRKKVNDYNRGKSDVPLGISVGIATAEDAREPLRVIYKKADDSMYRDKLYRSDSSRGKIVQSLLAALAERDYITEGHARRLEELCREIGEKIGLSSHQLSDLALLAQVHDLGKVGIPDQILYKPESLTEDEWEVMRGHPEKGYRIASASPDLSGVADLILKHHERWDGSGYPLQLKGKEIPIECRIMAIVDAFDAMTNKRPYNRVKSEGEALEEIKSGSGSQFDPELVSIFLAIMSGSDH